MRSSVLSFVALLFLAAPAAAQSCPPLHVRNPDGNYIVPGVKGDIVYSGDLALDAYVQQGSARRPSVVVVHGGMWSAGSRIAHVGQILEVLTRAGYNWFSVDYRLGGLARFEDSLADVRAALAFIRCRAGELGIDRDQLVLLGEDSGAQLAALLAAERPAGVIGAVLIGGFYDLAAIPWLSRNLDRDVVARASPITSAVSRMPPLLVVHGEADGEAPVEQARRYCSEVSKPIGPAEAGGHVGILRQVSKPIGPAEAGGHARVLTQVRQGGGRCRFVGVAGASHRSENWFPSQWGYKREMVEWLSALTHGRTFAHRPRSGVVVKDVLYSPSAQLKLDAYLPRASRPVPAVIVVHGGGWEAGDKVTYVTPLFEPLARARVAWFSIDYRLTPAFRHEDQLEDVRQAIRFVRAGARRFNIDTARIILVGESASAQMVTLVAAEDPLLAGVVSFYGVYDFNEMVTDASPRSLLVRLFRRNVLDDESRAELRKFSPLHRAHKDMPPILLVNGTGERLWAQAQAFVRRLTGLGARHEVIAIDGAPHGMENWEGHPEWTAYKRRVVEWIQHAAGPGARTISRANPGLPR